MPQALSQTIFGIGILYESTFGTALKGYGTRYNGQPIIAAHWDRLLGYNKIIGPVVLRQYRAKEVLRAPARPTESES